MLQRPLSTEHEMSTPRQESTDVPEDPFTRRCHHDSQSQIRQGVSPHDGQTSLCLQRARIASQILPENCTDLSVVTAARRKELVTLDWCRRQVDQNRPRPRTPN